MPGVDTLREDVTLAHHSERSWKLVESRQRQLADAIDPCAWRPSASSRHQLGNGRFGSRRRDLDTPILAVSNPPRKLRTAGDFAHEPAKANSLDSPDHFEMYRCHSSSAAARPSQKRGEHRSEDSGIRRFWRNGRNVNLAAADPLRQPIQYGRYEEGVRDTSIHGVIGLVGRDVCGGGHDHVGRSLR